MKFFKELDLLQKVWILVHLFIIVFCVAKESSKPFSQNHANPLQQIIKLAIFEEDLVTELFNLQEHFSIIPEKGGDEELCQLKVFKYISEYEEDDQSALENKKGLERAIMISEHPFLILKMIRRLFHTLLKNTMENCRSNQKVLQALQNTFKRHGGSGKVERPTEKSLEDALQRILMIHFIYGYTDASEVSLGILNGNDTKVVLNLYDCLELAKKAMEQNWFQLAYQWMSEATSRISREATGDDTTDIYDNWVELTDRADFSSVPAMHKNLMDKRQETLEGTGLTWEKYGLCRGELRQAKQAKELVCSYDWYSNPYFLVNPIKVERHSVEPLILEYHDFVRNEEMEQLKDLEFEGKIGENEEMVLRKMKKKIEVVTKLKVKGLKKSLERTFDTSLGSFCELEKGSNEYIPCKETRREIKPMATFYLNAKEPKSEIYLKDMKKYVYDKQLSNYRL